MKETPSIELSIAIPCLNEAETLASCILKTRQFIEHHALRAEIVIADMGGIEAAKGTFIIMGDAGARRCRFILFHFKPSLVQACISSLC